MSLHSTIADLTERRFDWRAWVWLALAAIWLWMFWGDVTRHPHLESSLGVPYVFLGLGPALVMAAHALYPTWLGWLVIGLIALGVFGYQTVVEWQVTLLYQEGGKWAPNRERDFALATLSVTTLLLGFLVVMRPSGRGSAPSSQPSAVEPATAGRSL